MSTYGNYVMVHLQEGILDLRVESACPLDDPGSAHKGHSKISKVMKFARWSQLTPAQLVQGGCTILFLQPGDALAEPFWFLEAFVANLSCFSEDICDCKLSWFGGSDHGPTGGRISQASRAFAQPILNKTATRSAVVSL